VGSWRGILATFAAGLVRSSEDTPHWATGRWKHDRLGWAFSGGRSPPYETGCAGFWRALWGVVQKRSRPDVALAPELCHGPTVWYLSRSPTQGVVDRGLALPRSRNPVAKRWHKGPPKSCHFVPLFLAFQGRSSQLEQDVFWDARSGGATRRKTRNENTIILSGFAAMSETQEDRATWAGTRS
jgi:hypothetical protein